MLENELKKIFKEAIIEVMDEKYAPYFKKINNVLQDSESFRVYSIPQVSRIVGRSDQTVRRWIREGLLTASYNNLVSHASLSHFLRVQEGLENKPGMSI